MNSDVPPPNELNPFDPKRLRINSDFREDLGTRRVLTSIPVRKPSKEEFIRVNLNPDFRLDAALIELKNENSFYLVQPALWSELSTEATCTVRRVVSTVSRSGAFFLWPLRLPDAEGNLDPWSRSALDAASRAEHSWIRIVSNIQLGAYEVIEAANVQDDPQYPEKTFQELLEIAFRDRNIADVSHPVLKRLRGEI